MNKTTFHPSHLDGDGRWIRMKIRGSWNLRSSRLSALPRGSATLQRMNGSKPGLTTQGKTATALGKRDAQSKRSAPGLTKFGSRTDAPQTATWSFGFRPRLR